LSVAATGPVGGVLNNTHRRSVGFSPFPQRLRHSQTQREDEMIQALQVLKIVYETIEEMGETGMPSGILYGNLMDKMSLQQYQKMIDFLKGAGLVTESNHILKATKNVQRISNG
jgi:hypothetical protein